MQKKNLNQRELPSFELLSNCCMRKPFSQGETFFHIFKTDKARFHHSDYLFEFTVFEQQELNKTTRHRLSEREKVAPINLQKMIHLGLI